MESNMEKWLPVGGYEGLYSVSDQGRIRSEARSVRHPLGGTKRLKVRMLAHFDNNHGYPTITLCRNAEKKKFTVHSLVLRAFVGPCPDGMEGCHGNGVSTDCKASNLRWDTRAGNHADKRLHGTNKQGERSHLAKLTADQVRAIKADTRLHREIAVEYGIHQPHVSRLKRGERWAHLG